MITRNLPNYLDNIQTHPIYSTKYNDDTVILDCGCNNGLFIDSFRERYVCDPHVYAFEPNPNLYNKLIKKYKENPKIHIHNYGVWNKDSSSPFYIFENDELSSFDRHHNEHKSTFNECITVETRDLNDIIEKLEKVDVLKLDTEGLEYDIINNLSKESYNKIKQITVEYHLYSSPRLITQEKVNECEHILEQNNFDIVYKDDGNGCYIKKKKIKTDGIVSWKDKILITEDKLGISAWDAHYFFGHAVFDAFRTYNHIFVDIDYHIDRLYRSAKLTGIDIKYSKEEVYAYIKYLMSINMHKFKDDEFRFMLFASPGNFKIYDDIGDTDPTLTIQLTTTSRYAKFIYPYLKKGWTSIITHQKQIPSRFLDVRIKSCSRLHYGMADMECKNYGEAANPILLDEHGNLCESSGSNIAFIKNKTVCIPSGTDMLNGGTMRILITILKKKDIPYRFGVFKPYDLIDCNGILYTSSFSGITPSYKLVFNSNVYHLDNNGMFDTILNGFSNLVKLDIEDQWKCWYEKDNNSSG